MKKFTFNEVPESATAMMSSSKGCADVMVTSPVYNIGKKYGKGQVNDNKSEEEYLDWTDSWIKAAKHILAENGSLFLNVGDIPSKPLFSLKVAEVARRHLHLQNIIHWVKSITINKKGINETHGHFKPINSKRYLNSCHEYIFHFTHKGDVEIDRLAVGTDYQDKSNIKRWNTSGVDKRCAGNVWHIPYETVTGSKGHPAVFPVNLVERCLKLHGVNKIKCVVDPFVGSGSAARATSNLLEDFHFIGYDSVSEYIRSCKMEFNPKSIKDCLINKSILRFISQDE